MCRWITTELKRKSLAEGKEDDEIEVTQPRLTFTYFLVGLVDSCQTVLLSLLFSFAYAKK